MKNVTSHTGTLTIVKRLPSSKNGNPRFLVLLDGYKAATQVDASLGYSIKNYDGKNVCGNIGTVRGTVSIDNVRLV